MANEGRNRTDPGEGRRRTDPGSRSRPDPGESLPPQRPPSTSRPSLSLQTSRALRDRADRVVDRVTEQAGRTGRSRRRYFAEQGSKLAGRLLPTAAAIGALTGVVTILDLFAREPPALATVAGAGVAMGLGVCALLVPSMHRRGVDALLAVSIAASCITMLGWGLIARATGGPESPYLMIIALVGFAIAATVPLPPWIAVVNASASYVGLWVATGSAPLHAHVTLVMSGIGGVVLARSRHHVSLATFRRIERLSAAVSRMRRVQEQLVVVEKLEALRVLVGGMAHELNNALAVSVASNQQAAKTLAASPSENASHVAQVSQVSQVSAAPTEAALAAIQRSDGGLARIRRTVDRLRRFAMSSEGILEPADVAAMLDFALESAIGRARSGVVVLRHYDPSVGAIECHVAALAEALFQIARNAVESMPGGGTIQASVRSEGDRVVLSVSDEGHGIPPDELAHVFDPFYSRGPRRTAKSGLGLSAVYGLVSALGGNVEIQSDVGKGTEVAIVLPRRRRT
ncbi:sensor histidine kinase [Pendulispora albinea]|uniref:histidine kinase n=1 Tax=Pendulispora albinea TaxID=2741071 RepID=A0ABZ2LTM4_9BACT